MLKIENLISFNRKMNNRCSNSENDDVVSVGEWDSSLDKWMPQISRNIKQFKEINKLLQSEKDAKINYLNNWNNENTIITEDNFQSNSFCKEGFVKNAKGHYLAANNGDFSSISSMNAQKKSLIYEEGESKITKDDIIEISFEGKYNTKLFYS